MQRAPGSRCVERLHRARADLCALAAQLAVVETMEVAEHEGEEPASHSGSADPMQDASRSLAEVCAATAVADAEGLAGPRFEWAAICAFRSARAARGLDASGRLAYVR